MNRKSIFLIVLLALSTFLWTTYPWVISAGGVGNIAIYNLDVSKNEFDEVLNQAIQQNPKIGIPDKYLFSYEGTGYEEMNRYVYLIKNQEKYIFSFKYSHYQDDWDKKPNFRIALTHAGKYPDKKLKSDRDLYLFQNLIWEKHFEALLRECDLTFRKE